jgi:hypothetical protein
MDGKLLNAFGGEKGRNEKGHSYRNSELRVRSVFAMGDAVIPIRMPLLIPTLLSPKCIKQLPIHPVQQPDIPVQSYDGHARIYDVRMGTTTVDVLAHPVTSVRCSSDGIRMPLLIPTLLSPKCIKQLPIHPVQQPDIPVQRSIASGSYDGHARIYDVRMGTTTVDVLAHPVTSVSEFRYECPFSFLPFSPPNALSNFPSIRSSSRIYHGGCGCAEWE